MPLEIKNKEDKKLLFSNEYTSEDFNDSKLSENGVLIELPFGTAEMKQWYFSGIRMAYSEWHYRKPATTEWKGELDVVTIYFNLKGKCSIQPVGIDNPIEFGSQQRNIFYSRGGNSILKNDDLVSSVFMVQFTREAFVRLTQDSDTILSTFSRSVTKGKEAQLSNVSLPIDADTDLIIKSILHCDYPPDLKRMFLLAKTIELLVLQAKSFAHALEQEAFIKTDYDKQRITFVKEVLLKNMQTPPSLPQLALMAGVNEYKLKKGFRELFGNSVFGYLSDLRLNNGRQQLSEKNKSVSEIAFELGYSSVQHFSTAFKNKFGYSPKNV
jgi:AraC family transcriptional activator of pyochelin receptor